MSCLPPLSLMNINLSGLTLIPDKLQLFKKKKKKRLPMCGLEHATTGPPNKTQNIQNRGLNNPKSVYR